MWWRTYGESRARSASKHRIALPAQSGQGEVQVDGVPQRDAVQDQAERAELVLHAVVVGAVQFAAAAVEHVPGQVVAALVEIAHALDLTRHSLASGRSASCGR
ncbi:hypothetical protein GCM10025331_70350 [Actinoplanes utahensis]|uniref:Uncharacterized protein n=1 Tax=Actinoplanes utahensis TaxID=1869 RepID=A0A0A6UKV3_ACTUT|nr:hypothetical protein MB27_21060 [Actinoplanes utahensis]